MTKEELIKILEEYEVFVDDDYGGSYQSIIAYTKDKKISKAFTSLGALKIINTFEKMQKEKQELIDYLKKEQDRLARECSHIYEDDLGKTRLVNEDIYNEVSEILSKIEKL